MGTTGAPTTASPSTESPTTDSPTTSSPTTDSPTTASPTTDSPTTESPTTASPTTARRRLLQSTTEDNDMNTTEEADDGLDLSGLCKTEQTAESAYKATGLTWTKQELHDCWTYVAIHCAVLRVGSMLLTLFLNNDGPSRVSSFVKKVVCCRCKEDQVEFDEDVADEEENKEAPITPMEESTKL